MREIKFRAWDGERMWHDVQDAYDYLGMDGDAYNSPINFSSFGLVIDLAKEKGLPAPMQFTGLKDKNGKEIYEGDFIVCKSYPFYGDALRDKPTFNELNYVGEVYCWEEEAGFYVDLHAVSNRVRGSSVGGGLSDYVDCYVIGNIYENPELLEKQDD